MSMPLFHHLVFDIHGVLVGRSEPTGHLPPGEVIARLRTANHTIRFLTNSSSVSRTAIVEMLKGVGVSAHPSEIFTASITVAHYLRASGTSHRLFTIGSAELRNQITCTCGDCVQWVDPSEAEVVVVSRDPTINRTTLDRLACASDIRLIATCRDQCFPNGSSMDIGPGPTVELVENTLDRVAYVLGKPNPYVLTAVMGIPASEMSSTLIIGDSIEQDIALGKNAGAMSVLLTSPDPAQASFVEHSSNQGSPRPDYVIRAIDELLDLL